MSCLTLVDFGRWRCDVVKFAVTANIVKNCSSDEMFSQGGLKSSQSRSHILKAGKEHLDYSRDVFRANMAFCCAA